MNSAAEHLRADEPDQLATDDFSRITGLTADQVRELVDYGQQSLGAGCQHWLGVVVTPDLLLHRDRRRRLPHHSDIQQWATHFG